MPIIEVAIVPVGTGEASMAPQVEAAQEAARRRGIKHQVTPAATILEGDLDNVLSCAREMHEAAMRCGSPRVVTRITIDERVEDEPVHGRDREERGERRSGRREPERRDEGRAGIAGADQRIPSGRAR